MISIEYMALNSFGLLLIFPSLTCLVLAMYSWRHRAVRGALPFCLMMLAVFFYSLGYCMELSSTRLDVLLNWVHFEYIGLAFMPGLYLWTILQHVELDRKLPKAFFAGIFSLCGLTLLIQITNSWHYLFYATTSLDTSGPFPTLYFDRGPYYWVNAFYFTVTNIAGLGLLLFNLRKGGNIYQRQSWTILIGAIFPILSFFIYLLRIIPYHIDPTPFAFSLTGIVIAWGLFRYQLFDLAPVARSVLIESLHDGILVLDSNCRVMDMNPAAARILGLKSNDALTKPVSSALSPWPNLINLCRAGLETEMEIGLNNQILTVSLLILKDGNRHGFLLVLRDITRLKQAENELLTLFSAMQDVVMVLDRNGDCIRVAPTNPGILHHPTKQMLGKNIQKIFSDEISKQIMDTIHRVLETGQSEQIEFPMRFQEESIWITSTASLLQQDQILWIASDITSRREYEEKMRLAKEAVETANAGLQQSLRYLEKLNEFSRTINQSLETEQSLQKAIQQAAELTGAQRCLLMMPSPTGWEVRTSYPSLATLEIDWIAEQVRSAGRLNTASPFSQPESIVPQAVFYPLMSAEKQLGVLSFHALPESCFDENMLQIQETVARQVAVAVENLRLFQEVHRLAIFDSLTGIFTRRHFDQLAENEYHISIRYQQPFSIIMLDIDHFKNVNDQYGHAAGDEVLRQLAALVHRTVRAADVVARYGGEEIIILLPATHLDETLVVAERIRRQIELLRVIFNGQEISVTASMGAAEFDPARDSSYDRVIQRADQALYEAKRAGRNCVSA